MLAVKGGRECAQTEEGAFFVKRAHLSVLNSVEPTLSRRNDVPVKWESS